METNPFAFDVSFSGDGPNGYLEIRVGSDVGRELLVPRKSGFSPAVRRLSEVYLASVLERQLKRPTPTYEAMGDSDRARLFFPKEN